MITLCYDQLIVKSTNIIQSKVFFNGNEVNWRQICVSIWLQ